MTAAAFGHPGCLLVFSFISCPNEDSEAVQRLAQHRKEWRGGNSDGRRRKGGRSESQMKGKEARRRRKVVMNAMIERAALFLSLS